MFEALPISESIRLKAIPHAGYENICQHSKVLIILKVAYKLYLTFI